METLIEFARNLGVARLSAIGIITALLLGFFIFLMTRLTTYDMSLLYGDLDPASADQIVTRLADQDIPFEIRGQGTEVWAPRDEVGTLRIMMAEEGLSGSVLGYELFDRDESLGQSSFVQEVNRLRALEGELARTITSLNNVQAARVHLVLPRRDLFSREQASPTASVVLKMQGNDRLNREQIAAIQHLVATAVPQLKPGNITIIDDRGALLSAGGDDEGTLSGQDVAEMLSDYETRLARRVNDLLESTLGIGKVRVEVRAEMDFNQVVINQESYNPEEQVLRSSQTVEEQASSREAGEDFVTVGNNLPDPTAEDELGFVGSSENSSRTEERSNFEIGKTLTNTVSAPGRVERQSVAVLVDGTYSRDAEGRQVFEPLPDERMQQLESLVKTAVGFDETRGDTLELVNMPFVDPFGDAVEAQKTFFGFSTDDIRRLVELLVLGILGILIVLLVVRPLLSRVFEAGPSAMASMRAETAEQALLTDKTAAELEGAETPSLLDADEVDEIEAMIDIANIEGRVKASSINKIGEIIEKHPEEAVAIIRKWMYQDNS